MKNLLWTLCTLIGPAIAIKETSTSTSLEKQRSGSPGKTARYPPGSEQHTPSLKPDSGGLHSYSSRHRSDPCDVFGVWQREGPCQHLRCFVIPPNGREGYTARGNREPHILKNLERPISRGLGQQLPGLLAQDNGGGQAEEGANQLGSSGEASGRSEEPRSEPVSGARGPFPRMVSWGLNSRSQPSARKALGSSSKTHTTVYVCEVCGSEHVQWVGRCPTCKEWNCVKPVKVRREGGGFQPSRRIRSSLSSADNTERASFARSVRRCLRPKQGMRTEGSTSTQEGCCHRSSWHLRLSRDEYERF